jgi:ketosteroid isomerase-like protein
MDTDMDDTRTVVEQFDEAFGRRDLAAVGKLITDDCVFEDTGPPDGGRHTGRDAVLAAFDAFFTGSPTSRFEREELVSAGDRAVLRWRYSWGDGHVRGVDVFHVRDGRVAEKLSYVKG